MKKKQNKKIEKLTPIKSMEKKMNISHRMNGMKNNISRAAKKIEPKDVAKGAVVVSVAAGAVAAGAILMDKENRRVIGKQAAKGMQVLRTLANDAMEEGEIKYQAAAHAVSPKPEKKTNSKIKRSKK